MTEARATSPPTTPPAIARTFLLLDGEVGGLVGDEIVGMDLVAFLGGAT